MTLSPLHVFFDSFVRPNAVLCWPWGAYDPEEDDGDPPPVVREHRGVPKDVSHIALSKIARMVVGPGESTGDGLPDSAVITQEEVDHDGLEVLDLDFKGCKYVLDCDVKFVTWLTTAEVRLAAERIKADRDGKPWYEFEGLAALMEAYEKTFYIPDSIVRLLIWVV